METPKKKLESKKLGRPTIFSLELADLICQRVATNTCGLERLCRIYDDLPVKSTINSWRYKYPDFSTQYAQAKLFQADLLAEECLEIADDASKDLTVNENGNEICNTEFVNRCRLRIDTRKWLASKLLPKQYGKAAEEEKSKTPNETIIEMIIDKLVE